MKWNSFLIIALLSISWTKENLQIKRNSLFGQKISIPNQKQPILVSFFTKGNQKQMNQWIESLNPKLLKRAKIKLLNIVSPGGLFFMIPKKKVFNKIRKIVKSEFKESISYLQEKERQDILNLDIIWLGDYKRQLFNLYKAKINQSTVILFDENGQQIIKINGYSKTKESKLKIEILKTIKSYNRFKKIKPIGHHHFLKNDESNQHIKVKIQSLNND
ncbi:MAG: hypothetical protein COB02_00375 [Candidatus Cloacimonadota bacterium]|nr:MAG: hypothetical protein COB02_00375 [Candidatus Cloacimonadota bacterium]